MRNLHLNVQIFKPFWTLLPCSNWRGFFFIFCQGEFSKQPKFHILFILTGKNALKWLEWHIFRVWGVQNLMAQAWSLYDNWFLKDQKVHILLSLTGKNASKWLEWCIFRVWGMPNPMEQVLSLYDKCFLKNQKFRQNLTFCWFWMGKMHQNGLSGAYIGFKACQIQWHLFQLSMISSSWKIKMFRDK